MYCYSTLWQISGIHSLSLTKRLFSWAKGVFILVIMKGTIYDLFLAIIAIFLLLTTILANQVEDEKDIEVRYWPSYVKLQIPTSNHFSQCCQCYGKCGEGSYLLATYAGESPNYFDCLQKCLNYTDPNEPLAECRFFTHDYASQGNCYLFSNCPKLDGSCLSCISGKYEFAMTDIQPII